MVVERTRRETSDTFTIELAERDLLREFHFLPGQFNMVGLPGIGEAPISISGDPYEPKTLVHTIREVGAVTLALGALKPGQEVLVRGPFGRPWPVSEAEGSDVVVVAGGIGLAPLRPVIYSILRQRTKFGGFLLMYGARTPADMLYTKQVAEWRSHLDFDLQVTVDRGPLDWRGNVGVVSGLVRSAKFNPDDTIAMVCGPEVMIRYAVQDLLRRGVAPEKVYVSMERNMKCGVGLCGHCQLRGGFICLDGPVYRWDEIGDLMEVREL